MTSKKHKKETKQITPEMQEKIIATLNKKALYFSLNKEWEEVKKCTLKLPSEFERVLQSKEDVKSIEKEAKKDQKLYSDVEAQAKVLELGAAFWKKLNDFVTTKKIRVSPDQLKAMTYAMRIPTQFPSAYQSIQLLALLEEAEANGFKE